MSAANVYVRIVNAEVIAETAFLVERSRDCLVRWSQFYAEDPKARKAVVQTKILIEEMNLWLKRL